MKNLKFKKLSLLSRVDKKARTVTFDPKLTVVCGENDTGKSSLIKSIYWVLGAYPYKFDKKWTDLNITGLLDVTINETPYSFMRSGKTVAAFDAEGKVLFKTNSITKEWSPFFADLVGFGLRLRNRQNEGIVPTPAFCFLPFYADQDGSWEQPWGGFDSLSHFANWQKDTKAYHCGMKPNKYFELNSEKVGLKQQVDELWIERNALERTRKKIRRNKESLPVTFNQSEYKLAVSELLGEAKALQADRNRITSVLSDLSSQRALLEQQASVVKAALSEFEKDVTFVSKFYDEDITCPTCGTSHDNSFSSRFSLMEDQEECRVFLVEVNDNIRDIEKKIEANKQKLSQHNSRYSKITRMLEEKRGKMKLKDIIENEGQRQAGKLIQQQLTELHKEISQLDTEIASLKAKMDELTSKKRKKEIEGFFTQRMQKNVIALNLDNMRPSEYERIFGKINQTGSDQPRAVLAYMYAFHDTLREYSSSPRCPLIIDSPLQQEQDAENSQAIFKFIFDNTPEDSQLILGTVSTLGVEAPDCKVIEFTEKYSMLRKEEYDSTAQMFRPYLDGLLG